MSASLREARYSSPRLSLGLRETRFLPYVGGQCSYIYGGTLDLVPSPGSGRAGLQFFGKLVGGADS